MGKIGLTSLQYTNQLDIQGTFKKYLTSVNLVKDKKPQVSKHKKQFVCTRVSKYEQLTNTNMELLEQKNYDLNVRKINIIASYLVG